MHRPKLSLNFPSSSQHKPESSLEPLPRTPSKTHRVSFHSSAKNSPEIKRGSESARVNPKSSPLKKSQFDYAAVGSVPIVIKDQQYIKRKQTFDTFLRVRDLELLLGVNHKGEEKNTVIDRTTSLNQVGVLHNKLKNELRVKLKNREGKMFSNELWSMDYYTSIIHKSSLKKKFDHISNLRFKPLGKKVQEVEDLFNRRMERNAKLEDGETIINKYRSSLINFVPQEEVSPERVGEEEEDDSEEESAPISPITPEKRASPLKAYFQSLERSASPEEKIRSVGKKNRPVSTIFTERTEPDVLHTMPATVRRPSESKHLRIRSTLENLAEEKLELESPSKPITAGNTPTASPRHHNPKAKFSSPSLATTQSTFAFHRKKHSVRTPTASFTSRDHTNELFNTSATKTSVGTSLFKKSSFKTNASTKLPTISHVLDTESNLKVENLIHQCSDLHQQHQDLVKNIKEQKASLNMSCKRRHHQKLEQLQEKNTQFKLDKQIKLLKHFK